MFSQSKNFAHDAAQAEIGAGTGSGAGVEARIDAESTGHEAAGSAVAGAMPPGDHEAEHSDGLGIRHTAESQAERSAKQESTEPAELCLLAGKIMLQSGAETYRVEDTMTRMGNAMGLESSHSYVTPTGIIFQSSGSQSAKLIRIVERTTDLQKVAEVNDVSRKLGTKEITPHQAHLRLIDIDRAGHEYSLLLQVITAAVASGCFTYMFRGGAPDILPAILCGGAGFSTFLALHRLIKVKFFAEFSASFIIGLLAVIFVALGIGQELDKIIIGSVMPLVPGLLITNAVRDLMAGHLVSGLSRGAEAFLTAFAIGAGIAVVVTIF
ncbi:Inner membrane protein YjjP [compost metagenome]